MAKSSSFAASLVFVAIIVAAAYFLNSSSKKTNTVGTSQSNSSGVKVEEQPQNTGGPKLYYFSSKDSVNSILSYDELTNQTKTIFTDADLKDKIKSARSISSKGILAVMGTSDSDVGALYFIDLQNLGKRTKILDNYANPQVPIISPDGNKILLVSFNNTEKNYGFQLQSMDIASSKKTLLVSNTQGFSSFVFDSNGQNVVYCVTIQNGSKIYSVGVNGGTPKEIFSTGKQTYSLNWSGDRIYFILAEAGPNTANQAEIYSVFEKGGSEKQLTKNDVNDNYPVVSSKNELAYFSNNFAEGLADPRVLGKILILNLGDNTQKEIGQGQYVIGWQ